MPLTKTAVPINFIKGLDLKSDPFQVPVGNFLSLTNSVFGTTGRLTKRNGYPIITTLPNVAQTTITTLNDNLIATGTNLYSYSQDLNTWIDQGSVQPVQLTTLPMVRNSSSQKSPDMAIADNGLACLAYMEGSNSYFNVLDSVTGAQIIERTQLPATATNPKVFILMKYFIITFVATVAAVPTLQFIAVKIAAPSSSYTAVTISADVNSLTAGYDADVYGNKMYIGWGASSNTVKFTIVNASLTVGTTTSVATITADFLSLSINTANNRILAAYSESSGDDAYAIAFNLAFSPVCTETQILNNVPIREISTVANGNAFEIFYEVINTYSYSPNASSDYVKSVSATLPVSAASPLTLGTPAVVLRSVGLISKPFIDTDVIYMIVAYGDTNQSPSTNNSNESTYFLIDSTGKIYLRLAYQNAGGYAVSNVLCKVTTLDGAYAFPYMVTDFLTSVNKGTNLPSGTPVNAIFTQTGINLASFTLNANRQYSSEIAGALHLTGGKLWEFDTVKPVEHGFNVYPENIAVTTASSGGSVNDQQYFYVFTYEWTDNAGNLHRSAPSIPVTVTAAGGNDSTNTIQVPTLRLTDKDTSNPVRIVGYRWSVAQQIYYQFTSVTNPTLNDITTDSVTFTDTNADASILGNTLLYTTGGVLENIAAPASIDSCLYDNRLFLIDAEDPNLLWYSKQVIQNTPVEMSDLLTIYIAPTTGAQQSTGPAKCIAAMDDKLVVFKANALYYINGSGPDNTGSNSTYSQPVYITGVVGSTNPNSVVLIPRGLMFQSNKGIWLLGRDLSTNYIGAPVEQYNTNEILSAEVVPNSTQVRFILDNGTTLMYDYFYDQWGIHTNISAISAVIYQGAHTYLNSYGQVYQEASGAYKDGSTPVLLSLTTAWINIAGVQGFERFYFAHLLGNYYSPFKLSVQFAYDYNPSPSQAVIVTPDNQSPNYGDESVWGGGGPWGGPGNVFSARIFPEQQKCQSFQVTIQEIYDPSFGQAAGQGLSLSGMQLSIGVKKATRTQSAKQSFG